MSKHTRLSWRSKSNPYLVDLQLALKPFGIYVYQNPAHHKNADLCSFILSDEPLSGWDLQALVSEDE